jgi:cell filamentation protein
MNIVWPDISKEEWVEANISGYSGDLEPLTHILNDSIS